MQSPLSGVVFCLDFGPFFFSSLVPLSEIFPLFIYLLIDSWYHLHWIKKFPTAVQNFERKHPFA